MWTVARSARWARAAGTAGLAIGIAACGPRRTTEGPAPEDASRDKRSTTASSVIGQGDLDRQRVTRVEEMIRGRVPGVEVTQLANGDYSIRIRGVHTIYGSNEPLYVVDGMPLVSSGDRSPLGSINPADVARIEVLKDAAATASWGVQGANGVILITTKRR